MFAYKFAELTMQSERYRDCILILVEFQGNFACTLCNIYSILSENILPTFYFGEKLNANSWFASDVTAAMLVVKNKRVSLRWEMNSILMQILHKNFFCIDHQHGRLVTWLQTKNNACFCSKFNHKLYK